MLVKGHSFVTSRMEPKTRESKPKRERVRPKQDNPLAGEER